MRIKIASVGEPVLRSIARPLHPEEITSQRIRELIEHMRETLADAPGVGLAAPQVGEPLQLLVVEDKEEYQANLELRNWWNANGGPSRSTFSSILRLSSYLPPNLAFFEGCLSLPGFMAVVPRARRVRVRALNEAGVVREIEAEGWYARILQHEIDHLRGTLYIDRMWSRSFSSLDHATRHWKSKSTAELMQEFPPAE